MARTLTSMATGGERLIDFLAFWPRPRSPREIGVELPLFLRSSPGERRRYTPLLDQFSPESGRSSIVPPVVIPLHSGQSCRVSRFHL
jgi:hypothetical protein